MILNVSAQADREFVEDHEEVAIKCAHLRQRANDRQVQATLASAAADEAGARVRRGLVRYKPALGATLPAQITDVAVEKDSEGLIVALHINEDAATFRAS